MQVAYSSLDLTGFSPTDKKIILSNEGKTPSELVDLGLSNPAYNRLIDRIEAQGKAPVQPVVNTTDSNSKSNDAEQQQTIKPTVTKQPAQPVVKSSLPVKTGQVNVKNRGTGQVVPMDAKVGTRLVANNSDKYEIV